MDFSVLMSLYHKESPDYLALCLQSLSEQTLFPNEVLIVFDGPITASLEDTVRQWSARLPINILRLENNVGLGPALNEGLKLCRHEVIFRMDTDDICHPLRFERQIEFLLNNPHVGLLSTWVGEFDKESDDVHSIKKIPIHHNEIVAFAKKRNPFNHMAVGYRKSAVLSAGAYQDDYLYEDYALWVRMIKNGVVTANLPDVLVYARTGNGMEFRRGGLAYFLSELKVQYSFYKAGFTNVYELIRNIAIRLPVRFVPGKFRKYIYRKFLRE
ncbi:glycosyltransferase [Aeromonas sp. BC14]|nr:glycosyltransferase [Aeromonas sp. BC14]WAF96584.1 glycosyltransferase [Aeromonas sp. BC14]